MNRAFPDVGLRRGQAGVTLIEMMIVLAVIGVATGAATLGLGALARDDAAERAAQRLAAVIGAGVDEALISGVSQVLQWDAQGYRIGTADRHDLAAGVSLSRVDGAGEAVVLSSDATSPASEFVLQGDAAIWRVSFDGVSATVLPAGATP